MTQTALPGSTRERIVSGIVLVGLIGTFVAAVSLPGRRADRQLRTDIDSAQALIIRGPLVLEQLKQARRQLVEQEQYLQQTAETIPTDPRLPRLLNELHGLAHESRLMLVRIEPQIPAAKSSYVEHSMQIELRGTHGGFLRFLHGLEQAERLIHVTEATLATAAGGKHGNLEGRVKISVFSDSVVREASAENSATLPPI